MHRITNKKTFEFVSKNVLSSSSLSRADEYSKLIDDDKVKQIFKDR